MKKPVVFGIVAAVVAVCAVAGVVIVNNKNGEEKTAQVTVDKTAEALKFKEYYEGLNGKTNASGAEHRTVNIPEDNPFVAAAPEEIVKKIENEETFYFYIGDTQCPWCRSVIEKFIEVAKKNSISTVYYANIWDADHNEILRDVYKLDESGKPYLVKEGTEAYKKLLEYGDGVLSDYTLTDSEKNKVSVGEKRVYAPNFFYVEKGKVKLLVSGESEKQTGARDELTAEILKDEETQFQEFFTKSSTCDSSC